MFLSLSFVSWQWGSLSHGQDQDMHAGAVVLGGLYCIINRIVGSSNACMSWVTDCAVAMRVVCRQAAGRSNYTTKSYLLQYIQIHITQTRIQNINTTTTEQHLMFLIILGTY
jgi:hypothetical protein